VSTGGEAGAAEIAPPIGTYPGQIVILWRLGWLNAIAPLAQDESFIVPHW